MAYIAIDREPLGGWDEPEEEQLMTDEEFDAELAEAAQGRGELFEDISLEEFKEAP
jgi:hypothetical protein